MPNKLSFKVLYLKFGIFILVYIIQINLIFSQNPNSFPQSWLGRWKGEMVIYNGPEKVQSLPMQLHILPTDSINIFTYRIIYGVDTVSGDRPYLLKVIDPKLGKYLIDEQNSIVIDAFLLGSQLSSCFEVEGNLIFDILEKNNDNLYWKLISAGANPIRTTGNTTFKEEAIPPVKAYPLRVLQTAELKR